MLESKSIQFFNTDLKKNHFPQNYLKALLFLLLIIISGASNQYIRMILDHVTED